MWRVKYSWTHVLFNLSCILILSRASGLAKDIPKSVKGGDTLTSIGNKAHRTRHSIERKEDGINVDRRETGHLPEIALHASRFRRAPVFMDSGYGSRLSAVSELARDMALRRLFGNGGPGKRSSHDMVNQRQQLPHLFREFTKRDHGYGSRVRAGHNMVNSLHARKNLFGAYGPGRKRNNVDFNDNFLADQLDTVPLDANFDTKTRESEISNHNADLPADYIRLRGSGFVRALANPLQSYEPQSSSNDLTLSLDEGYKSRIEAADQLAHDIETQEKIFGPLGPGRK